MTPFDLARVVSFNSVLVFAPQPGFEPGTYRLTGERSKPLSY